MREKLILIILQINIKNSSALNDTMGKHLYRMKPDFTVD